MIGNGSYIVQDKRPGRKPRETWAFYPEEEQEAREFHLSLPGSRLRAHVTGQSNTPRWVVHRVIVDADGWSGDPEPPALDDLLARALRASEQAPTRARIFTETAAPAERAPRQRRSPDVAEYAVAAALGHCDRCNLSTAHGMPVKLQAHHILDFGTYPERDDIWNVVALCGVCHDLCPPLNTTPEGVAFNEALNLILSYTRPPMPREIGLQF